MILRIGTAALRGDIARYARHFDLLELRAEPGRSPRPARLAEWQKSVPERFVTSVVMPRAVSGLESGDGFEQALAHALRAAEALDARWLVLVTPPAVTPSSRNRKRLADLVERLGSARRIAWEPRGLWEDDDAEALAATLGVALVRDLGRSDPPDGDVIYTRLRGLGDGGTVRTGAVERAADSLDGCSEAYVIVDGAGAVRAAALLRQTLSPDDAATHADPDADPDDELDELDDESEESDDDDDEDEA